MILSVSQCITRFTHTHTGTHRHVDTGHSDSKKIVRKQGSSWDDHGGEGGGGGHASFH